MNNTKEINLNIKFNRSYIFFKWILQKYKTQLPYNGEIRQFAITNNYCPKICDQWRNYGVGYRVWNLLHKDLIISFLIGKIDNLDLYELEREFLELKQEK
jgi:hypothetical protein